MAEHPTGDTVRREAIPEEGHGRSSARERLAALRLKARKLALRLDLQRPLVHLDLESTGIDVGEDHIVRTRAGSPPRPADDSAKRGGMAVAGVALWQPERCS